MKSNRILYTFPIQHAHLFIHYTIQIDREWKQKRNGTWIRKHREKQKKKRKKGKRTKSNFQRTLFLTLHIYFLVGCT